MNDTQHDPTEYPQVHFLHCFRGEYASSCKYGSKNCPAKQTPLNPFPEDSQAAAFLAGVKYWVRMTSGVMWPSEQLEVEEEALRLYPLSHEPHPYHEIGRCGICEHIRKIEQSQPRPTFTVEETALVLQGADAIEAAHHHACAPSFDPQPDTCYEDAANLRKLASADE